jgi:hypothetical protein
MIAAYYIKTYVSTARPLQAAMQANYILLLIQLLLLLLVRSLLPLLLLLLLSCTAVHTTITLTHILYAQLTLHILLSLLAATYHSLSLHY